MDKPDLVAMFLKDAAEDEDTAALTIAEMTAKDFVGLIISFVQELGKSAAQEAFAFIEHRPDERERITQLVRMTHRSASIEGILDRLGDTTELYEPSARAVERSVVKAYALVAELKRRGGR